MNIVQLNQERLKCIQYFVWKDSWCLRFGAAKTFPPQTQNGGAAPDCASCLFNIQKIIDIILFCIFL